MPHVMTEKELRQFIDSMQHMLRQYEVYERVIDSLGPLKDSLFAAAAKASRPATRPVAEKPVRAAKAAKKLPKAKKAAPAKPAKPAKEPKAKKASEPKAAKKPKLGKPLNTDVILELVRSKGTISAKDVMTELGSDRQTTTYWLRKLRADGTLAMHGDKRFAVYTVPGAQPSAPSNGVHEAV